MLDGKNLICKMTSTETQNAMTQQATTASTLYVNPADYGIVVQADTRTPAQRQIDELVDEAGGFEQGCEPYPVLRDIASNLIECDTLRSIKQWFEQAVPEPTDDNKRVQHGCHLEEVAEMFDAVGDTLEAGRLFTMASAYKRGAEQFCVIDHVEHLDSICDQIVTLIGKAHMHGYDIFGALAEVNRSNWSKFVDGKPVFNEFGKIQKGPNFFKPDLAQFIDGSKA